MLFRTTKPPLTGVALAYLVSQAFYVTALLVVVRNRLGYRISVSCALALLRGLALTAITAILIWAAPDRWTGYIGCVFVLRFWMVVSLRDQIFTTLARKTCTKFWFRNKKASNNDG